MAIEKFTMEDVDQEIMQIVQQLTGGSTKTAGPPDILKSILDRAKAPRNRNNGNAENQT